MSKKAATRPPKRAAEQSIDKSAAAPTADASNANPVIDPLSRLGLTDWFDRWPEVFAHRWPESFGGLPFVDESFRMEQFVDDDGTFVVRGELPGLDVDKDVTITRDDGRLTIAAKREDRSEETKNGRFHSEFHYGSFQRTIRLPAGARGDDAEAVYANGILEVRIPIDTAAEQATKIPIVKKG